MKAFLRFLGIIILLLGVAGLVVYKFAMPENALLIASVALEIVGIVTYIVLNRVLRQ